MKSVPSAPKQYGYTQVEELIKKVINQVKSNEIDRVYKTNFNYRGTQPVVSAHNCFKFLGTHQVCAWKNKPYSSNPNMIVASFKLKVDGNQVMQFSITTGVMLPEFHGTEQQDQLLSKVIESLSEKLVGEFALA